MSDQRPFTIPRWVPDLAGRKLVELNAVSNQPEEQHALLGRLASDLRMREVWRKTCGHEDEIVYWAFVYALQAKGFVPAAPTGKTAFQQHASKYASTLGRYDVSSVVTFADMLLQAMAETEVDARFLLSANANTGKTVDEMRKSVMLVRNTYRDMQAKAAPDPQFAVHVPRKQRSKNAPQTIFTRAMSTKFQELFGQPLDEMVAALLSVVFDLSDGPASSTVRGRRRSAAGGRLWAKTNLMCRDRFL
jgi:hypothetical protein